MNEDTKQKAVKMTKDIINILVTADSGDVVMSVMAAVLYQMDRVSPGSVDEVIAFYNETKEIVKIQMEGRN